MATPGIQRPTGRPIRRPSIEGQRDTGAQYKASSTSVKHLSDHADTQLLQLTQKGSFQNRGPTILTQLEQKYP